MSISPSLSVSQSPSVSPSISPSPSPGWVDYTRGDYSNLPVNDNDLETIYTAQDYIDVATIDNIRVGQTATSEYAIHQFKDFASTETRCTLEWYGQTDLAPSSSTVYLQIYNTSTGWETVDSDNSTDADTNFTLTASIPDLTNYKNGSNVIACRVYQLNL